MFHCFTVLFLEITSVSVRRRGAVVVFTVCITVSLFHCFRNFTGHLLKNYLGIFVRSKCIINGSAGFLLCPCSGKPC